MENVLCQWKDDCQSECYLENANFSGWLQDIGSVPSNVLHSYTAVTTTDVVVEHGGL